MPKRMQIFLTIISVIISFYLVFLLVDIWDDLYTDVDSVQESLDTLQEKQKELDAVNNRLRQLQEQNTKMLLLQAEERMKQEDVREHFKNMVYSHGLSGQLRIGNIFYITGEDTTQIHERDFYLDETAKTVMVYERPFLYEIGEVK